MELTPQQLKELDLEGFKDYKTKRKNFYTEENADTLVDDLFVWMERPNGKREIVACDTGIMRELISRDCKPSLTLFDPSHAQRFGSKYDYDLHETMPYLDSEEHQAERLIRTLEFNRYINFGLMTKDDAYRLSEAKLELINRN